MQNIYRLHKFRKYLEKISQNLKIFTENEAKLWKTSETVKRKSFRKTRTDSSRRLKNKIIMPIDFQARCYQGHFKQFLTIFAKYDIYQISIRYIWLLSGTLSKFSVKFKFTTCIPLAGMVSIHSFIDQLESTGTKWIAHKA